MQFWVRVEVKIWRYREVVGALIRDHANVCRWCFGSVALSMAFCSTVLFGLMLYWLRWSSVSFVVLLVFLFMAP